MFFRKIRTLDTLLKDYLPDSLFESIGYKNFCIDKVADGQGNLNITLKYATTWHYDITKEPHTEQHFLKCVSELLQPLEDHFRECVRQAVEKSGVKKQLVEAQAEIALLKSKNDLLTGTLQGLREGLEIFKGKHL